MKLELDAWRTLGRAGLEPGFQELAPAIHEALGARELRVYRLDPERLRTEVLASSGGEEPPPQKLSPEDFGALLTWAHRRKGAPLMLERGHPAAALEPRASRHKRLVGPLHGDSEPIGVLYACAERASFAAGAEATLRGLLEPFATAMQHELRLQELNRLREGMEADKRALLQRLERHDISDSVIGADTGLREVSARIEQVARTDAPVLILGETGSGKEVVARAIHSRSHRAQGPIVRVNCGAIPSELVDSELFGHERGSFTGAVGTRRGWFERADGGVLFLDEVGELPLAAQVRLLRVLQDGIIERVGASRPVHVDVRIIAATHRDLQAMVAAGTFREDLWYRISVFPLRLPPLRERLEDIPALAAHLTQRACRRVGVPPLAIGPGDISLLVSYPWPGNVRELAAVIERAVILGDGKRLALAESLGTRSSPAPRVAHDARAAAPPPALYARELITAERIQEALAQAHGRVDGPFGAAQALGLPAHRLRTRMKKLGVDWRGYR